MPSAIAALLLLLLAAPATPAHGQTGAIRACGSDEGRVTIGVLVDDSTGAAIDRGWVYLGPGCRTTTDENGRFMFTGVSAADSPFDAGARGYRRTGRSVRRLSTGDTTRVEIRLRPGGPLEDCRVEPECAPLVDGGAAGLEEEAGFRLVAYGTIIALIWDEVMTDEPWVACVVAEEEDFRRALTERYSAVSEYPDCLRPREEGGGLGRRLTHVPSGRWAFRPRIAGVGRSGPGERMATLSYHHGPLWGAQWECTFERTDQGWRPTACTMTGEY